MVALACAHWAKFASAVGRAIGPEEAAKLEMPEPLASLHGKPTRVAPLPNDVSAVRQHIHATLAQAHEPQWLIRSHAPIEHAQSYGARLEVGTKNRSIGG
ncbi:hypothetical protein EMIHUDRAFT_245263 [Emiliania huxleyi CCMP1516]|uniref:Uncharacterized protein n=2 Tax=Emiliania huxleyi TaxID=2903 RepID=A0A0D3IY44_EMIH1|nr:hypothetical protein EMIHUDRAFT_245263 [Emiliania huxleyi CCMP1516]EOD16179.1 hypothetical protein EMIHUDRAFT_245263 [Emiliania huxleyi CCMP1516]|eukprot:XP_005768608.1 hypothetical protein EMIHUDRAFT_245263 [Emiliania huxleyi CCMP1516]